MKIEELQVLITANTNGLKKEIQNTQTQLGILQKAGNKTSESLVSGVNFFKRTIATVGLGTLFYQLSKNLDSSINRLDTLNNYSNVMENLKVGTEDANWSIKRLTQGIEGLPTTLDSAALAVQRFTSANKNVKASTEMYLAMNNALLAGGASYQLQATAMEQLAQAYSKGKFDMMEWRSLLVAMPGQLNQIAEAMGYVNAEKLGKDLREGNVSMNKFMQTAINLNKTGVNGFKSFEEQAMNSTNGVATSMTNVKTAITKGLAQIMDAIGRSNIASFFNSIKSAINSTVPYISAFIKLLGTAISTVSALFGKSTKKSVDNVNISLTKTGATAGNSLTSGLNKATGATKKLKKELNGLASFDDMNILKAIENSNNGGSSSGDGTGVESGDFNWTLPDTKPLDDLSSKVDEIYNKLLLYSKELFGKINFDNLVTSWKELGIASDKTMWGLIQTGDQFMRKFISPLTKWAIEKSLPNLFKDVTLSLNSIKWSEMIVASGDFFEGTSKGVSGLIDLLQSFSSIMSKAFSPLIGFNIPPALGTLGNVLNIIGTTASGAGDALRRLGDIIRPVFEKVATHLKQALTNVRDLTGAIKNNEELWNNLGKSIGYIVGLPITAVLLKTSFTIEAVSTVIDGLAFILDKVYGTIYDIGHLLGINKNSWEEEKAAAEANRLQKEQMKATEELLNSEKRKQTELNEKIKQQELEASNAEIAYTNSIKRKEQAYKALIKAQNDTGLSGEKLRESVENGTLSYEKMNETQRKVYDAYLNNQKAILEEKTASDRLNETNKKLQGSQDELKVSKNKLKDSIDKEYYATMSLAAQRAAEKGDYKELEKILNEVSNSGKKGAKEMQEQIGRDLATTKKNYDTLMKTDVPNAVKKGFEAAAKEADKSSEIGKAIVDGARIGVEKNESGFLNVMKNMASNALKAVKKKLGINSPSKEFMKLGSFTADGFVIGFENMLTGVKDVMNDFVDNTNQKLDIQFEQPSIKGLNTSGYIATLNNDIKDLNIENSNPIHLVLNVGNEKLVDQVVDGVNNKMFQNNEVVFNL